MYVKCKGSLFQIVLTAPRIRLLICSNILSKFIKTNKGDYLKISFFKDFFHNMFPLIEMSLNLIAFPVNKLNKKTTTSTDKIFEKSSRFHVK